MTAGAHLWRAVAGAHAAVPAELSLDRSAANASLLSVGSSQSSTPTPLGGPRRWCNSGTLRLSRLLLLPSRRSIAARHLKAIKTPQPPAGGQWTSKMSAPDQQPWFEALQLDAEQEAKVAALLEAVVATVNVSAAATATRLLLACPQRCSHACACLEPTFCLCC